MRAMSSTRQVKERAQHGFLRRTISNVAFSRQESQNSADSGVYVSPQAQGSSSVVAFTPSMTSPLILEVTQDSMTTIDTTELHSTSFVSLDSSDLVRYEPYLVYMVNLTPK